MNSCSQLVSINQLYAGFMRFGAAAMIVGCLNLVNILFGKTVLCIKPTNMS